MSFWEPQNVAQTIDGKLLPAQQPRPQRPYAGAVIDSRLAKRGSIFFALSGEQTNGHLFIKAAAESGAAIAVIDDPGVVPTGVPSTIDLILVNSVRQAMLDLAQAYRATFTKTRVIAVTGSNGKTTTTRLLHSVLSTKLRGSAPARSFNNELGVPLTVLGAQPEDDYLLVEIGMNAPGEIARLAAVARPHIGVITSIGRAHMEGLGSVEAIAAEKASLFGALEPDGHAIFNPDDPIPSASLDGIERVSTFGSAPELDERISDVAVQARGTTFKLSGKSFEIPLLGEHNTINAAAAAAIARVMDLDDEQIRRGFASVKPAPMRLERQDVAGIDLINDAYNANPDSMLCAIKAFAAATPDARRRFLILGDMLEIGPDVQQVHEELGRSVASLGQIDAVVFIGQASAHAARAAAAFAGRVHSFEDLTEQTSVEVASLLETGDAVLLKASRGMRLERIVDALQARVPSDNPV